MNLRKLFFTLKGAKKIAQGGAWTTLSFLLIPLVPIFYVVGLVVWVPWKLYVHWYSHRAGRRLLDDFYRQHEATGAELRGEDDA